MQRIALLGAGFIGKVHARNLAAHPRVDLAGIFDVDQSSAREVAALHGTRVFTSVEEALTNPAVDGVLIASSTNTHAQLLTAAAEAGKAIFCEKPIDLSFEVAESAAAAAKAAGVPVMIDFCRRFDPSYAALREAVTTGEVGDVELIQMTNRGPSLPPISYLKVSGGQMRDQTIHFFDLACWITGLDPVSVFAAGSALADSEVAQIGDVDTSVVTLQMANGALCEIDSQRRIAYGYDERIEVSGSRQMVEAARQRTGWTNHYGREQIRSNGLDKGWFERIERTFRAALDEFVSAVEEGRAPSASIEDGLRAQRIADAATQSLTTGQLVEIAPVAAATAV